MENRALLGKIEHGLGTVYKLGGLERWNRIDYIGRDLQL